MTASVTIFVPRWIWTFTVWPGLRRERVAQLLGRADALAADRDDHVAAEHVALAGDDDVRRAALQPAFAAALLGETSSTSTPSSTGSRKTRASSAVIVLPEMPR